MVLSRDEVKAWEEGLHHGDWQVLLFGHIPGSANCGAYAPEHTQVNLKNCYFPSPAPPRRFVL